MQIGLFGMIRMQYTAAPPVVETNLEGQTVIITGANAGVGFETAKHLARMSPGKLIMACRDQERGNEALRKIEEATGCNKVELWLLDLANFASVKSFADRFNDDVGRLDILIENAAAVQNLEGKFEPTVDGWEPVLQVNGLSTSLLALLLLPKMLHTEKEYQTTPRLVVVASEVHQWSKLDNTLLERDDFFEIFGRSSASVPPALKTRYQDSKLLNALFARALNDRLINQRLIVNLASPGFCYSNLRRDFKGLRAWFNWLMEIALARPTEEGSRPLIYAAIGGGENTDDLRGKFIALDQAIEESDFVISKEGRRAQDKLWDTLIEELVKVDSRVADVVKNCLSAPREA